MGKILTVVFWVVASSCFASSHGLLVTFEHGDVKAVGVDDPVSMSVTGGLPSALSAPINGNGSLRYQKVDSFKFQIKPGWFCSKATTFKVGMPLPGEPNSTIMAVFRKDTTVEQVSSGSFRSKIPEFGAEAILLVQPLSVVGQEPMFKLISCESIRSGGALQYSEISSCSSSDSIPRAFISDGHSVRHQAFRRPTGADIWDRSDSSASDRPVDEPFYDEIDEDWRNAYGTARFHRRGRQRSPSLPEAPQLPAEARRGSHASAGDAACQELFLSSDYRCLSPVGSGGIAAADSDVSSAEGSLERIERRKASFDSVSHTSAVSNRSPSPGVDFRFRLRTQGWYSVSEYCMQNDVRPGDLMNSLVIDFMSGRRYDNDGLPNPTATGGSGNDALPILDDSDIYVEPAQQASGSTVGDDDSRYETIDRGAACSTEGIPSLAPRRGLGDGENTGDDGGTYEFLHHEAYQRNLTRATGSCRPPTPPRKRGEGRRKDSGSHGYSDGPDAIFF